MIEEHRMLESLEPVIKIVKERESIFFELLSFANKNIESSSNEIDQITIFSKYIVVVGEKQLLLMEKEGQLLRSLGPNEEEAVQALRVSSSSKQMIRLFARVVEILEASIEKTRNSLFNENGRIGIEFARFKKVLHKILQNNPIELYDFAKAIINFVKNKFRRQLSRLKSYLQKLQDGQHVSLKQMFSKDASDNSVSPDQKIHRDVAKDVALIIRQSDNKSLKDSSLSLTPSPVKRPSFKRPDGSRTKKTLGLRSSKKQSSNTNHTKTKDQDDSRPSKSTAATQILKFCAVMQLYKKDFLEDFVFQKIDQQKQRKRLLLQLTQRNRLNAQQINQYYKKCQNYNPSLHVAATPNSDDNKSVQRNDSSVNSRASIKTSFVISRRKPSFTFESASDRSDVELIKNQMPFSRTIKNLTTRKRAPSDKTPRQVQRSKKIFVVKSPLNFGDDVIPRAQVSQTGWIQTPLTGREKQHRKNQSLRLKKRNNPIPLDQKFLPESFRFSQHPF